MMFTRFEFGNRLFTAFMSLALTGTIMATLADYATPVSGIVA
ncbi:MAG: hypothetical protein ACO25F_08075 [Erythrobacter sp.]